MFEDVRDRDLQAWHVFHVAAGGELRKRFATRMCKESKKHHSTAQLLPSLLSEKGGGSLFLFLYRESPRDIHRRVKGRARLCQNCMKKVVGNGKSSRRRELF